MKTRNETSAGGVVFRARGDAFDIVIIKTHEGRWQLPKGWIESGESAESAALREAREEGGVDAEIVAPLEAIDYWFRSTYEQEPVRIHKHVHFFLMRYTGGDPRDHDDEVLEARWVDIGEAHALLSHADERRVVTKARDLLERASQGIDARPPA